MGDGQGWGCCEKAEFEKRKQLRVDQGCLPQARRFGIGGIKDLRLARAVPNGKRKVGKEGGKKTLTKRTQKKAGKPRPRKNKLYDWG